MVPERGLLGGVVDVDAPLRAVADVGPDELAEVADGDGRLGEPGRASCRSTISRIECSSPIGTSGLGIGVV